MAAEPNRVLIELHQRKETFLAELKKSPEYNKFIKDEKLLKTASSRTVKNLVQQLEKFNIEESLNLSEKYALCWIRDTQGETLMGYLRSIMRKEKIAEDQKEITNNTIYIHSKTFEYAVFDPKNGINSGILNGIALNDLDSNDPEFEKKVIITCLFINTKIKKIADILISGNEEPLINEKDARKYAEIKEHGLSYFADKTSMSNSASERSSSLGFTSSEDSDIMEGIFSSEEPSQHTPSRPDSVEEIPTTDNDNPSPKKETSLNPNLCMKALGVLAIIGGTIAIVVGVAAIVTLFAAAVPTFGASLPGGAAACVLTGVGFSSIALGYGLLFSKRDRPELLSRENTPSLKSNSPTNSRSSENR